MTRVLLVDPSYKGALPLYTGLIAKALVEVGAEPTVLAHARMVDPELDGDWPVLRRLRAQDWPPPPGRRAPSALAQGLGWLDLAATIWRTARQLRPDVIHIQHPLHPRLDAWLLKPLRAIAPVAWTAHDVLPHDGGSNAPARASRIYRACDAVLVHNTPARDLVRRIAGVEASVVDHPVRPLPSRPTRAQARSRLGLESAARVVSAVGFIRGYKGYGLLADALPLCRSPDLRLVIAGQLVDEGEGAVLDRLRADPRTMLRLGYVSEAELIDVIAASDAVLLPHAAGSDSGSLHMARALGVPVLASDAPQIAAVVAGVDAGRVLPREPQVWADALDGPAPPPPATVASLRSVGERHLDIYRPHLR